MRDAVLRAVGSCMRSRAPRALVRITSFHFKRTGEAHHEAYHCNHQAV
ncbi:unnamed protein product [Mycetohabitans rhizoxinica HKI 454]|uniref:Uncharacterized protein n=1 Tax=Mycetohabitans rhizoxinica (strain DSM 19002 / CIP 109453 / HKI 454) TaxID=882378 RepID=E5ANH5_MYCRK|nr:unnamed protein product [Mycetohabitans rhizoxinica HKI 454]